MDAIINLQKVNIFQEKNLVLNEVNLTVNQGEFVYLIGKTGSGKSSLLKTMYADLPLKEGDASVVGFDLKKLKRSKIPFLRRKIGIVFQDFQLLTDRSVIDNITFVMKATGWKDKKKMTETAESLLAKVGLGTKGFKMPHELSGGEQQRVGIARALINDPEVILADEPTGNLDPETSKNILDLLYDISKNGKAVIMATHDYTIMEQYPGRKLKCEGNSLSDI